MNFCALDVCAIALTFRMVLLVRIGVRYNSGRPSIGCVRRRVFPVVTWSAFLYDGQKFTGSVLSITENQRKVYDTSACYMS